jgi:hypothetical protein
MDMCLSYDVDAYVYAEKDGLCMTDQFLTGLSPNLYMYAYGTCLPSSSLWNEAQVSGEFRDPGFDGYAFNMIVYTGQTVGRTNGGFHCDGWNDIWEVSNSPCP